MEIIVATKLYDIISEEDRFDLDILRLKSDTEGIYKFWNRYMLKHYIREMNADEFLKLISNEDLPYVKIRDFIFLRYDKWLSIKELKPGFMNIKIIDLQSLEDSKQEELKISFIKEDSSVLEHQHVYIRQACVPFDYTKWVLEVYEPQK